MKTGTIILIPFPFAELTNIKVRPAMVLSETHDKYQDLILCAISSVVPNTLSAFETLLLPNTTNNLRVPTVLKIDRIVTLKKNDVIATLGKLSADEIIQFKEQFKRIVD